MGISRILETAAAVQIRSVIRLGIHELTGSPVLNLSPSVSPTASSVSNASVPENVADFYGLDGTILHETIYNELMDIVMLMMQVGVGAV